MPSDQAPTLTGTRNPYIGPRPFRIEDRDSFFGRDREARDLIPLVIAERLVLFYAQSGAGKSSLINARLIPGLQERHFKVLPVSRVSGQSDEGVPVDNFFTYNLLLSLDRQNKRDPGQLAAMTLSEYLADLDVEVPASERRLEEAVVIASEADAPRILDAPQIVDGVYPIALIIDQFEEIFTSHPQSWRDREPFFRQLSQAMEADPYLWVILVMREDYVASVDPFAYLLPGRLRARYYMQRMSYEAALEAVKNPAAQSGRPFEPGVAEDLVNNLRMVAVGMTQDGQPRYAEGQFVEPVQLQVVCYQLWEQLEQDGSASITAGDLQRLAKGKDLAQFVSSALANFYNQAIESVTSRFPEINERKLRDVFSKQLITEARTRGLLFKGEKTSGDLPNEVLNWLESKFIIRAENRGASTWYELVHDRFVDPILLANQEWNEDHPRPFQADAEAWIASGKDPKKLYEGRRLSDALKVMQSNPDELSPDELEFIRASQAAAEVQRSRRQRLWLILAGILFVVMATLTVYAVIGQFRANAASVEANQQRLEAEKQKNAAVVAQQNESQQRKAAEAAKAEADQQRQEAEKQTIAAVLAQGKEAEQRKAAEAAKAEADQQRAEAEKQKNAAVAAQDEAQKANTLAQASRLASLADYFRGKKLDLSLLMAIGGVDLSDNWETRQSLLNSLQVGLADKLDKDGSPFFAGDRVYSVAYSTSGDLLAVGLFKGDVKVVYSVGHGAAMTPPASFTANGPVNSLSFSAQDEYLASGGDDGKVRIWKLNSTDLYDEYAPFLDKYTYPSIQSVAFQPGGTLLAIATVKEATTQLGHVVLYDYQKKTRVADLDCGPVNCSALAWSPDGKNLAIGNERGMLQVWGADSQKIIHNLGQPHQDSIKSLAWFPDSQRLVSGGLDKRLILWDTSAETQLQQTGKDETPVVLSLGVSANGRYLVVGSNDPKARITVWDAETLQPLLFDVLSTGNTQNVNAVAVNPRGDRFATGGLDAAVILWRFNPVSDLVTPLDFTLNTNADNRGNTLGLAQKNSGEFIQAQQAGDATLKLWTQNSKDAASVPDTPSKLAFGTSKGQPVIALGDLNGSVTLLDRDTGKQVAQYKLFQGTLSSVALGGDGKWLAAAGCLTVDNACNHLILWDVAGNQNVDLNADLASLNIKKITSLAFSPDGNTLAIGTQDSRILFYDIANKKLDQAVTEGLNLQGAFLEVTSLAFSPDEVGVLAAGFRDGRIALWEVKSRDPIGEYANRMSGQIAGLVFSKEGQDGLWTLTSASDGGEVWQWQVDLKAWTERACALAGRNLTADETAKFIPATAKLPDVLCPNLNH